MKPAALALMCASLIFAPAVQAFDPARTPTTSTFFYVSIPLDAKSAREREPSVALSLRGQRDYQVIYIDERMMSRFVQAGFFAGASPALLVGGIAAVAAVAVAGGGGGGGGSQSQPAQTQAQQAQPSKQAQTQQASTSTQGTSSNSSGTTQGGATQGSSQPAPCPKVC